MDLGTKVRKQHFCACFGELVLHTQGSIRSEIHAQEKLECPADVQPQKCLFSESVSEVKHLKSHLPAPPRSHSAVITGCLLSVFHLWALKPARWMCTTTLFILCRSGFIPVTPGEISRCKQDKLVLFLALLGDPEKIPFLSVPPFLFLHFRVGQICPNADGWC